MQTVSFWNEKGEEFVVSIGLACEHGPMAIYNFQATEDHKAQLDGHCPVCGRRFKVSIEPFKG